MKCPECKSDIPEGLEFCITCGAKVEKFKKPKKRIKKSGLEEIEVLDDKTISERLEIKDSVSKFNDDVEKNEVESSKVTLEGKEKQEDNNSLESLELEINVSDVKNDLDKRELEANKIIVEKEKESNGILLDKKETSLENVPEKNIELNIGKEEEKQEEQEKFEEELITLNNLNKLEVESNREQVEIEKEKEEKKSFVPLIITVSLIVIFVFVGIIIIFNKDSKEVLKSKQEVSNSITNVKNNKGILSGEGKYLKRGQLGLASMYNIDSGEYLNVDVSIINFYRGTKVLPFISKYVKENPTAHLDYLKQGMEWVAVEYEVTLNNFPTTDYGVGGYLDLQVMGMASNNVVYEGKNYAVNNFNIEYKFLKNGESGKAINIYQLPKGCTNYLLKFGSYNKTNAFFKGE